MITLPADYRCRDTEWTAYNCPHCSDTKKRFCVRYTKQGWYYHCFNCHPRMLFHSILRDSTPKETLAYLAQTDMPYVREDNDDTVSLPVDFQYYIPEQYQQWLDQYKITQEEIWEYGIGYSPGLDRLIMPCYDGNGKLKCWQGRGSKPKYLTEANKGQLNFFQTSTPGDTLVLVEDILSAIKVGRVSPALALLGSHISPKLLTHLSAYDRIIIWLDYDKTKEAFKYQQRLTLLLKMPVSVVYTAQDPKALSTEEIRRCLK